MTSYDNNMSGVLFKNDRKEKDNHPDYTGSCEIDGRQFWISAWLKVGKEGSKKAGQKFFSMSYKPKDDPNQESSGQTKQHNQASSRDSMDDDNIPF